MDFGIKAYQVYFYSAPASTNVISPTATIFLYDLADVFRGELVFYPTVRPGDPTAGVSSFDPGTGTFRAAMDYTELPAVLAALQLDTPCHIRGYDKPRPELHTGKIAAGYGGWPRRLFDALSGLVSTARSGPRPAS